jgi:hypothetical protein
MESWVVVFLGIIALCSAVQTAMLIAVALGGLRLARRLDDIQKRIDEEIRPGLRNLALVSANVAEISSLARAQAMKASEVVSQALDRFEETVITTQKLVLKPLAPLADAVAFIRGIRRGVEVFRRLGGADKERSRDSRQYSGDDEHLFI